LSREATTPKKGMVLGVGACVIDKCRFSGCKYSCFSKTVDTKNKNALSLFYLK
jgi:hypothetical protein